MQRSLLSEIEAYLSEQQLPMVLVGDIERYYLPFVDSLKQRKGNRMLVLGVNGAQGSGKSTLAAIVKLLCAYRYGWSVAVLSLDDLYLGRATRQKLAADIHPLLVTRGVPGTHDVQLGIDTIAQLAAAGENDVVRLPRFDKAMDEPVAKAQWPEQQGPVDLLIFEGWCLACHPQAVEELIAPCNALEVQEDAQGVWRRYVNRQLGEHYPPLFRLIDVLLFLKVPDMQAVLRWRSEQEDKLARKSEISGKIMDAAALAHFVSHFERLTRHQLMQLPQYADVVFELDQKQRIVRVR